MVTQKSPYKNSVRTLLERVLPAAIFSLSLSLWRRIFWWNRSRTRPTSRREIRRLMERRTPLKLEIGSGPRSGMEDWVSLNLGGGSDIQHDLLKPLPFPDGSVDMIYSSHVLEHFTYPDGLLFVLRECSRVLKPGGTISAAVPNGRIFLEGYFHPETFDLPKYCSFDVGLKFTSRIDVVNFIAYLGGEHRFLFDEENLPKVFQEAGFLKVTLREYDPAIDLETRRHESIYVKGLR